jgi:hypothetical protein
MDTTTIHCLEKNENNMALVEKKEVKMIVYLLFELLLCSLFPSC